MFVYIETLPDKRKKLPNSQLNSLAHINVLLYVTLSKLNKNDFKKKQASIQTNKHEKKKNEKRCTIFISYLCRL